MKMLLRLFLVANLALLVACKDDKEGDPPPPPPPPPPPTTTSLTLDNRSGVSVFYFYISPSTSLSWGVDQLGSTIIPDDETFTLDNIPCGEDYDVKVEASGRNLILQKLDWYLSCDKTYTWRIKP